MPGGATGAAITVLVVFALSAFVLDAFEIVFVIVPIVMPSILTRAPDAVWISVLALLALQASFLVPPTGYAVMMARSALRPEDADRPLARALAPYSAPSSWCWRWWCCCRGSPISPSPRAPTRRPSKRSTTRPPASASTTC